MGTERLATIATELMAGGLDASTPVAIVRNGTRDEQQVLRLQLHEAPFIQACAPSVIVIGAVADLDLRDPRQLAQLVNAR
jgi:siroheme synthase